MLQVDRLYVLQYMMLLPAKWRSPLSDHYMKMADSESGRAFILSENGTPVAYAVLIKENSGWILKYIYTDEEKRRKHYASYLIRQIVMQLKQYVRVHMIHTHPYYHAVASCLEKLGFVVNDTSCVYAVPVGESLWKRMDELQLQRMKEFLLRDGSECVSFSKMGDDIKKQLMESASNRFSNSLNPEIFFKNSVETVDFSISNVLVKDGELEAYTLITRPSRNTVSVEQIAEAKGGIGSGMIVAPLCESLEAIRAHPEITMMKMTISDRNTRSYRLVMEVLKGQKINVTKNSSYIATAAIRKENIMMKTMEELYNEVMASEKMKKEFLTLKPEEVEGFAKKYGCEATFDEIKTFLEEKSNTSGELSDDEIEQVTGGKGVNPHETILSVFTVGIGCTAEAIYSAAAGYCGESDKEYGLLCHTD